MSKFLVAGEAVERELTRLQGLNDLRDVLQQAGNLEQTINDLNIRATQARAALAGLDGEIAEKQQELRTIEQQAEQIKADAQSEADRIVSAASDQANKLTQTTRAKMSNIESAALGRVQQLENQAKKFSDAIAGVGR